VSVADADAVFYEDSDDYRYEHLMSGAVAGGDTDGDGFDDLLITSTGPAHIFRGGPR
jgi:hypothetical protein